MRCHVITLLGVALLSSITAATRTHANVAPATHLAAVQLATDDLSAADGDALRAAWEARQPQTIGALAERAYLKASNTEGGDEFGTSVAVSGDTVVVGAKLEDSGASGVNGDQSDNSVVRSGAAYVFVRDGETWSQQAYLKASNPGPQDFFGWVVAISGDTIVVASPGESSNATGVNGDQDNESAILSGAAYVFVRDGTTWSQQAYLKASNTRAYDSFGSWVDVSGDTVIVGASAEDSSATGVNGDEEDNSAVNSGAAYVFVRNGESWSQEAYLKASNTEGGAGFGTSVAVSGDTAVVGAPQEDSAATGVNGDQSDNSAVWAGAAYVFVRDETGWSQQAYLKASNTDALDEFGLAVAADGDTVVVGAYREDSGATGVDGDQLDDGVDGAGAAYAFVRNETSWSQQAYLKASNTGAADRFGYGLAVSGDRIVVGAPREDSSAAGTGDAFPASGAAYAFVRNGAVWSPLGHLKASNAGAGDEFGTTVAVWGDTFAISALHEDGNATGVDGEDNDLAGEAGAVYVDTTATWTDLGNGLAGTGDVTPILQGDGALLGNDLVTLALSDALPGAPASFVLGATNLGAPFKGGVLVPSVDVLLPNLPVDVDGTIVFRFTWPAGLPSGLSLYYQYWIVDAGGVFGFSASNGLQSTTP